LKCKTSSGSAFGLSRAKYAMHSVIEGSAEQKHCIYSVFARLKAQSSKVGLFDFEFSPQSASATYFLIYIYIYICTYGRPLQEMDVLADGGADPSSARCDKQTHGRRAGGSGERVVRIIISLIYIYIYIYVYMYGYVYFVPLVVKAYWVESMERFSCPESLNPDFRPRVPSKQVGDVFTFIWGVFCIDLHVEMGRTMVQVF